MNSTGIFRMIAVLAMIMLSAGTLPAQVHKSKAKVNQPAASSNSSVKGSGTSNRIAKWVANSDAAGDYRDWEQIRSWAASIGERLAAAGRESSTT